MQNLKEKLILEKQEHEKLQQKELETDALLQQEKVVYCRVKSNWCLFRIAHFPVIRFDPPILLSEFYPEETIMVTLQI